MLSVNNMLNQDQYIKQQETTTSNSRPSVLTISHLLCDPPTKSPSLSPSSSPSPTDSYCFPFQELTTPPLSALSSPSTSTTSLHSMLSSTNSDFSLHTRPFLPTTLLEEQKRRSPLPTTNLSDHSEQQQEEEQVDDDDDQSSIMTTSSNNSQQRIKAKRRRANAKQLSILNQVFDRTFFPSTQMRAELGRQLGMSPRTVQIWFQNKRQAMRTRERQRLLRMKDEN
ncbi:uncharacterized protein BX664DRAFT_339531 [Halteromyces radiatus]|uniref:uncharacterized protein n=1 Tax=Halteromyces radiatus TaxID=101107 RepID=UPI00221FBF22|nr:uncharacterized protein BX664DRAFT_339531 [Halteromyces radiatus]KAI8082973.1 hypothetical protein BX664DRAFT_339531 [Halteromyces radiatus]